MFQTEPLDAEGPTESEIKDLKDCLSSGKSFRSCHENGFSGQVSNLFCSFTTRKSKLGTNKSNEAISQSKRYQKFSSKLHKGNARESCMLSIGFQRRLFLVMKLFNSILQNKNKFQMINQQYFVSQNVKFFLFDLNKLALHLYIYYLYVIQVYIFIAKSWANVE